MEKEQKRKWVLGYISDPDLVSDEAVDLLLKLMNSSAHGKDEILTMAGYDVKQSHDSAYPQPYADSIRDIYPEFNNGWHFYDYSEKSFGEMKNVYNMFAKRMLSLFN